MMVPPDSTPFKRTLEKLETWLASAALAASSAALGFVVNSYGFQRGTEATLRAQEIRITNVETGLTTPMARSTAERFDSVQKQLDDLREHIREFEKRLNANKL